MDIKNLVTERVAAFVGQKSAAPHGIVSNSECEAIKNFVTRRGRLRKIWGATLYEDLAEDSGEIKWIDYMYHRWVCQRGNSIFIESGEGTGSFFKMGEIEGGGTERVFSDKWVDLLFFSNGFENKFIESDSLAPDSLLTLGVYPPGGGILFGGSYPTAELAAVPDLSSSLSVGDYQYAMTFWDNDRQVESLPYGSYVDEDGLWATVSDLAGFFMDGGVLAIGSNESAEIDVSPILALGYDASRVTHYRIYRKDADGSFKLVPALYSAITGDIDIYEQNVPISQPVVYDIGFGTLGAVTDLSLSPPPGGKYYRDSSVVQTKEYGPHFVKFFRDQLWLFGVNFPGTEDGFSGGRTVRFYPLNGVAYASDVGLFDYWKYSYSIGRETGQRDTFVGIHRNTLLFFKEGSSYYLDGTSPANYEVRTLDDKRGITIPGSAQETTAGIIGLGAEGFTLFDSTSGGKIISEEIADMVEKINLEHFEKITSSFDPQEEKYECHCPIENTHNTLVFILDIKSMTWSFTKKAGGAAAYGLSSSRRVVGLLGDKLNGRLYLTTDRSAVTFNGETMHGSWRSKHFDFGKPGDLKGLQAVTIVARAKRDFRVSIDVIPDFAQKDAVSVSDIAPDVRNDILAEDADDEEGMLFDEGQWSSGTEKKEFTILVQAIGKKFQLIVRNSDVDADRASFEIEEITLWASLLDGDE